MRNLAILNLVLCLLIFNPFTSYTQESKAKISTQSSDESKDKVQDNSKKISNQSDNEKEIEKKKIEANNEFKKKKYAADPNNSSPDIAPSDNKVVKISDQKQKDLDKAKKETEKSLNDNKGKGNAYGKNKEDLERKDFDQKRAAESKQRLHKTEDAVKASDDNLVQAKKKLESARNIIGKAYKEEQITKEDYERRMNSLSQYEAKLKAMEIENSELKKEINIQAGSSNKILHNSSENKQFTDDEYKKKKEDLDKIDKSKNPIKKETPPNSKVKK